MIYSLVNLPAIIRVGVQLEKGVEEIGFDIRDWLERYPGLKLTVNPTRPGESASYPAADTALKGTVLYWYPNRTDTAIAGNGFVEISGETESQFKLTGKIPTVIEATSLGDTQDPPAGLETWYEKILHSGGGRADMLQDDPDGPGYVKNRTHWRVPDHDIAYGTAYPTPKVEVQLIRDDDGSTSGYSMHKILNVTPAAEVIKNGTVYTGTSGLPIATAGVIVNVTEKGYTLVLANSYNRISAAVCFEAGYEVSGNISLESGTVIPYAGKAVLPEPGVYLIDLDGADVTAMRRIKWDGYIVPLGEEFLPDALHKSISIPDGGVLTIGKDVTINDPNNLLSGGGGSVAIYPTAMEGDDPAAGISCTMSMPFEDVATAVEKGVPVMAIVPFVGAENTSVRIPLLAYATDALTFMVNTPYGWYALAYNADGTASFQILTT